MDNYTQNIASITEEWILERMQYLGLKRKNLTQDLGLDSQYLSLLFTQKDNPRKIHLSKPMKALFYYYFKIKEIEIPQKKY